MCCSFLSLARTRKVPALFDVVNGLEASSNTMSVKLHELFGHTGDFQRNPGESSPSSDEGSLASDASLPACRHADHEEQAADAGKDVGDHVQAVAGDRCTEGQPEQAGREDGSNIAEGLELAAGGAHVLSWGLLVEGRLQAEVVEAVGDAEDGADRQEHTHRGGGVAGQQQEGARGGQAGSEKEGWAGARSTDEARCHGRGQDAHTSDGQQQEPSQAAIKATDPFQPEWQAEENSVENNVDAGKLGVDADQWAVRS